MPAAVGAYLLALKLNRPLPIAGPSPMVLPAGYYLYAGSAHGPGGLKARVGRHMRRPKLCHWHIDQISAIAGILGAFVWPGGNECALVAQCVMFGPAVAGFGSSDCRRCRSHLLGPLAALPHLVAPGDHT